MDIIKHVEDGIMVALAPLSPEVRTMELYAGQLETGELNDITIQFPCIYVFTQDIKVDYENLLAFADLNIGVLIGDRNLRGPHAAQRGDGSSGGVYMLMQTVREALNDVQVFDDALAAYMTGARPLVYRPRDGLCIWMQTYKIKGKGIL